MEYSFEIRKEPGGRNFVQGHVGWSRTLRLPVAYPRGLAEAGFGTRMRKV